MSLPILQPFDYKPIYEALNKVKNTTVDEATMLTELHDLLLSYTPSLSARIGFIEGLILYLDTAKGRAEYGLTEEEVVNIRSEGSIAKNCYNLIDKTYFLITQKAKILLKNT